MNLNLYKFKPDDRYVVDVMWGRIETEGSIEIPIDMLYYRTFTPEGLKLMKIHELPHYRWLSSLVNNKEDKEGEQIYRDYLKTYWPAAADSDFERSKSTVRFYKESSPEIFTITIYPPSDNVIVFDGTHRSVIAKAMKHDIIKCLIFKRMLKENI